MRGTDRDRASGGEHAPRGRAERGQRPLPYAVAVPALARCVASTAGLLARRRIHLPVNHPGICLRFADGTSAAVFRETVVDGDTPANPCVLVVAFRLRLVRGRGHALFCRERLLNTPLFVGFPGFVSKLWLAHDQRGTYRGFYEWDGPARAEHYARALWRVLAVGSVPGSIGYKVRPRLHRDEVLTAPHLLDAAAPGEGQDWWRLVGVA